MLFTLKLISGEVVQHNVKFDVVTIGRSKNCSIVAPYEGISRHHCQIDFQNGEIFVTDLASTNGVFIDGTKIEPNIKTQYQTYLTLSVGSIQSITIEFDDKTGIQTQNPFESLTNTAQKTSQPKEETQLTKTTAYSQPPMSTDSEIKVKSKKSTTQITSSTQASIKIPNKKKEKKNSLLTNIVAVLLLIGAIAWYARKDKNHEAISKPEETISPVNNENNFEQF